MANKKQPACPECEKLVAVSEDSNKIGGFLDWMQSKGFVIAGYEHSGGKNLETLVVIERFRGDVGINKILAEYYDIDLGKVEKERRALLEWIREVQS